MTRNLANLAASVRARLQTRAKEEGRPFQEFLQYYGLERFLFRLSRSAYRDKFVLKGGLMLRLWDVNSYRPTRDIDLLGFTNNQIEEVEAIVRDVCSEDGDDDGVVFDINGVTGERIKEDADYEGIRIKFLGFLERARIPMQIDIAFGDIVHPEAVNAEYPTLLNTPAPTLRVYPRETVIAEKFQAMVHLGAFNSRMKDFYDIWLLSTRGDYDGLGLAEAILKTFRNRDTAIESDPIAFRPTFYENEDKEKQWAAFRRKSRLSSAPADLGDVVKHIRVFLGPVADAIATSSSFQCDWQAPGPWRGESA